MRWTSAQAFAFAAASAAATCVVAFMPIAAGSADDEESAIFGVKISCRISRLALISVAHEAGSFNDLRAVLGNDVAIKAFREGTRPFPDGAIMQGWLGSTCHRPRTTQSSARLNLSFPEAPQTFSSCQDSKRYASTGGWGFGRFEWRAEPQRRVAQHLLPLPRSCAKSRRFGFHALRAVKAGRRR